MLLNQGYVPCKENMDGKNKKAVENTLNFSEI